MSEYGLTPDDVCNMPASDVYMILYARKVNYINDKMKNLKNPKSNMSDTQFNSKYGD